jgi:hypothetical protein
LVRQPLCKSGLFHGPTSLILPLRTLFSLQIPLPGHKHHPNVSWRDFWKKLSYPSSHNTSWVSAQSSKHSSAFAPAQHFATLRTRLSIRVLQKDKLTFKNTLTSKSRSWLNGSLFSHVKRLNSRH